MDNEEEHFGDEVGSRNRNLAAFLVCGGEVCLETSRN